ncbi:MAG: T9SS type A sorting domain-containing protein [Bacteroidia bacterium]|nr:T9SS type A sorting domain-containing protein [Bacteroidia bacterium]
MKKIFLMVCFSLVILILAKAQQTVIFNSSSNDGYVDLSGQSWSTLRNATQGSYVNSTIDWVTNDVGAYMTSGCPTLTIARAFMDFNTSNIPDNATICSAKLKFAAIITPPDYIGSLCAMKGTQLQPLSIQDFDAFSGLEYGHVLGNATTKDINFNANGISDINKTGLTKICVREYGHDYLNVQTNGYYTTGIFFAESNSINKLEVVYVAANAGPDQTICSKSSTTLNASGGTNYLWSTGETTASIVVAPISTTTYTVTVSVAAGCSSVDQVVVNTIPSPTVNLGTDMNICANFMYTLNAGNPGATYNWTRDGVPLSQHTQTITTNLEGNYCVTVTNTNGCSATDCIVLTYYPGKLLTAFTQSYSCVNNTIQIQVTALGNGSLHNWDIFPSDAQGTILGNSIQTGSGASFTFNSGLLPDQYYSIKHIIYGFCGNFSTIYQTIFIDMPTLNSDFVPTLSLVQNGFYSVTATMAALPAGALYYWKVEELDANGNTIPNTVMENPSIWWANPLVCTFPQYCCNDVNNTPNGKFYPNHTYRITRGTWSSCNPWSDISYTFTKTLQKNGQYVETISKTADTKEMLNKPEIVKENTEMLSVYPNPAEGMVNLIVSVDKDQRRVIQLADVLGNVINEWIAENGSELPNTIDLTSLKKGIYFLRLTSERNMISKKIIKQ